MNFIELTFKDDKKALVNINDISSIIEVNKKQTEVFIKDDSFYCKETYKEVKEKIQELCK